MGSTVKAIVFGGGGSAGTQIVRTLHSHGIEIVGAVELAELGDIGVRAGIGPLGIQFETDAAALIGRVQADVAIIAVGTTFAAILPTARLSLSHGINVVTIAEDAFYPWNESTTAAVRELDELATANGVTFFATGMQDVFWQNTAVLYSTVCRDITKLELFSMATLDGASDEVLETIYAGWTVAEFEAATADEQRELFEGPLTAIAADLGLTPSTVGTRIHPIVALADHYATLSDRHIGTGRIIGTREVTTMETAQGIPLVAEFHAKLPATGESDSSWLVISGDPGVTVRIEGMRGFANTAAIAVNRIPDVLAAEPGYLRVRDLPRPAYKTPPTNKRRPFRSHSS